MDGYQPDQQKRKRTDQNEMRHFENLLHLPRELQFKILGLIPNRELFRILIWVIGRNREQNRGTEAFDLVSSVFRDRINRHIHNSGNREKVNRLSELYQRQAQYFATPVDWNGGDPDEGDELAIQPGYGEASFLQNLESRGAPNSRFVQWILESFQLFAERYPNGT